MLQTTFLQQTDPFEKIIPGNPILGYLVTKRQLRPLPDLPADVRAPSTHIAMGNRGYCGSGYACIGKTLGSNDGSDNVSAGNRYLAGRRSGNRLCCNGAGKTRRATLMLAATRLVAGGASSAERENTTTSEGKHS